MCEKCLLCDDTDAYTGNILLTNLITNVMLILLVIYDSYDVSLNNDFYPNQKHVLIWVELHSAFVANSVERSNRVAREI